MRNSIDEEEEESSSSRPPLKDKVKGVEYYLEELIEKKGPKREEALVSIVEILSNSTFKLELDFLETNFATFLYRCLVRMKKGSTKELHSASQAIGLLALIIDDEDDQNEIYRESLPVLSEALKSGPKTLKVFDCLAMGTFFGATNSEETQTAMQMMWKLIHPESGSDIVKKEKKHLPDVLVAALSAWNFLLASLERWSISSKYWKGAVSHFSNLLESDDQAVSIAAGVGLVLIFEKESVDKFCSISGETYTGIKESVKAGILEKLERLCLKQTSTDDASGKVREECMHILDYFKSGFCPKISISFCGDTLVLPSWSKIVQRNYLKSFLGDHGLNVHNAGNPKLQAVFGYKPTQRYVPRRVLYEPTLEKASVGYYLPKERDYSSLVSGDIKKDKLMRISKRDKAQTQLRNKTRKFAEERKYVYDFD